MPNIGITCQTGRIRQKAEWLHGRGSARGALHCRALLLIVKQLVVLRARQPSAMYVLEQGEVPLFVLADGGIQVAFTPVRPDAQVDCQLRELPTQEYESGDSIELLENIFEK